MTSRNNKYKNKMIVIATWCEISSKKNKKTLDLTIILLLHVVMQINLRESNNNLKIKN